MLTGSLWASKRKDGSESGTASILCRSTVHNYFMYHCWQKNVRNMVWMNCKSARRLNIVEQVMSHSVRQTWLRKLGKFSLGLIIEKIVFSLKKPTVRCFPLSDKKVLRLRVQIWPSHDYNSKIAKHGKNLHTEIKTRDFSTCISSTLHPRFAESCTRDLSFFTRDFCSCISSILYPRFLYRYLYQLSPVHLADEAFHYS